MGDLWEYMIALMPKLRRRMIFIFVTFVICVCVYIVMVFMYVVYCNSNTHVILKDSQKTMMHIGQRS